MMQNAASSHKPAASTMQLVATLLDEAGPLPARYAAMFALRNRGGGEAIEALGRAFSARSALLKHEAAYVLGQMQDAGAIAVLRCGSAVIPITAHFVCSPPDQLVRRGQLFHI
jgi:HEAT repeat protein